MTVAAALAALAAGCLLLAGFAFRAVGPGYRVARVLAATPQVDLKEAVALAHVGHSRYVRVEGRISSDEEFPDEHDRPLVFRRTRIQIAGRQGRWQTVNEDREAVPFWLEARSVQLAIDGAALAEGLVVVPREAGGRASDLPADLAAGHPAEAKSRLLIEQVSAVEHAIVAGVPMLNAEGAATMGAGLGRPLILSTVEVPSAMRLLARGKRQLVLAGGALLAVGLLLSIAALVALLTTI
jgi:hypothetical protein